MAKTRRQLASEQAELLECRGRTPQPGEEIHPDLATEPTAEQLWAGLGWLVEAMAELISPDCPTDLRQTVYFHKGMLECSNLGVLHARVQRAKQLAEEVLATGYERTGWPVVKWNGSRLTVMDGRRRLAIQRARGVPARAILLGQPS